MERANTIDGRETLYLGLRSVCDLLKGAVCDCCNNLTFMQGGLKLVRNVLFPNESPVAQGSRVRPQAERSTESLCPITKYTENTVIKKVREKVYGRVTIDSGFTTDSIG